MKKIFLVSVLIQIALPILSKHVIFDLGGVLLSRSKAKVVRHVGVSQFCSYFFRHGNYPQKILDISMNVLDLIEPPIETENEPLVHIYETNIRKLPSVTCKWLAGLISSDELHLKVAKKISELDTEGFFASKTEKELVTKSIDSMFNPVFIARSTKKIHKGIALVRDLVQNGHIPYILSNWDIESFKMIYENPDFSELFNHFEKEHILISGEINDYKPHSSAFDHFLKRFSLDASQCIFIDDQEENIVSAQSLGIHSYHLPRKKFKTLRKKLKRAGIL